MKREDILDAMSEIGDDLIEETDELRRASGMAFRDGKVVDIRQHRRNTRRWTALAASLAIMALAAGTIFALTRVRMGHQASMSGAAATAEATMDAAAADEAAKTEEMMPAAEEPAAEASEETVAEAEGAAEETAAEAEEDTAAPVGEQLLIRVQCEAGEILFELNDSSAARDLYDRLPLTIETAPCSDNEITFPAPDTLDVSDCVEGGGSAGVLGYFHPWNNVVMYYGDFDAYPGLYILGEAVEGAELIPEVTGEITVTRE